MRKAERLKTMGRVPATALLIAVVLAHGQGQRGAPVSGFGVQPPLGTTPKPAIANAKPVRSL